MWNVSGDAFSQVEGAGVLEIVNLSLDELEMEAVLFTQDDHSNENSE